MAPACTKGEVGSEMDPMFGCVAVALGAELQMVVADYTYDRTCRVL